MTIALRSSSGTVSFKPTVSASPMRPTSSRSWASLSLSTGALMAAPRASTRRPCHCVLGHRLRLDRVELRLRDRARVEQLLRLGDLGGRAPCRLAQVLIERLLLRPRLRRASLAHPLVLGDQVDEYA